MSKYTQAQLDALRTAYVSGALTVEYNGRRVTYRSRDEMAVLLAEMESDLTPTAARRRSSVVEYDGR